MTESGTITIIDAPTPLNETPKCCLCGKFIGCVDFAENNILVDFTPDTAFTVELTEYTHKSCTSD